MPIMQKLRDEVISMALLTGYFGVWIGTLALLKTLILAEYRIEFHGFSLALVGALVLAKVVLILRGRVFMQAFPNYYGIVRVLYKTIIYLVGVFVILAVERVVEAYGDAGGLLTALKHVAETRKIYHVMAVTLLVGVLLTAFNCWEELLREVGRERVVNAFLRKKNSTR